MKIVDKILNEASPYLRAIRAQQRAAVSSTSDRGLEQQIQKLKVGDIFEINGHTGILTNQVHFSPRSNKMEISFCDYKSLADLLKGNSKKSFYTLKPLAIKSFTAKGKVTPGQLKKILDAKESINKSNNDYAMKNLNAKEYQSDPVSIYQGNYVVKMQDGNTAKAGDNVMVKFSNGEFSMTIAKVGGTNKNGEIMVINSHYYNVPGKKSRGVSAASILRKG